MSEQTPQQLGKYEIIDEIGKGGFATVYRARDPDLDREVALKVLHPLLMRDPEWVARFRREARAVARLDHPHIVTIYEVGQAEGLLYIAMRLVADGSLAQRIAEDGPLPWEEAVQLVQQIASALDFAHEHGVIHRDLKAANVLLDKERGAQLTDFGFARMVSESTYSTSVSGGVVGTPQYIAPEVWEGKPATAQTDVYALGCILYEMVMGEHLFNGDTTPAVMRAHFQPIEPPEAWPEGVPPGLGEVLHTALAKEPEERYGRAGDLTGALAALKVDKLAEPYAELEAAVAAEAWEQAIELAATIRAQDPDYRDVSGLEETALDGLESAARRREAATWREEADRALAEGDHRGAQMAARQWQSLSPDDLEAEAFLAKLKVLHEATEEGKEAAARKKEELFKRPEAEKRSRTAEPAPGGKVKPPFFATPAGIGVIFVLAIACIGGLLWLPSIVPRSTPAPPPEATATPPPPEQTTPPPPEATPTTARSRTIVTVGATGSLVIVIGSDPSTLDPQFSDDRNERAVNDNIYEMLLFRDGQTGEIGPGLAEAWEQVDDTTWRFTLRQGVTFHNGEPFNADAVVYSVERIIDPEFSSEQISFVETVSGAQAVDEYTVDIMTEGPDPLLPARLTWMKIVPPEYTEQNPDEFANNPVGTGPYQFVEWVRGDHVTLEANTDYWGGAPSIATVTIRRIEEIATAAAALQAGEVDLVQHLIPESLDQVPKSASVHGIEFPWIRINTNVEPLNDVRVRQALNYAIDKEALRDALYSGYAAVAEGQILTPGHFGYNPDVKAYPYDPEKARQLLQEAGAEGATLEFIGEAGRWLKDKELVEALATQLDTVGLNIEVNIAEWSQWLDLLFAGAEAAPDLQYSSHDNSLFDADRTLSVLFTSEGSQAAYANAEVDRLVNEARTETDAAAREDMYHQAVQIIHDEAACVFLLNLDDIYGLSQRLEWQPRIDGRILVKDMTLEQ